MRVRVGAIGVERVMKLGEKIGEARRGEQRDPNPIVAGSEQSRVRAALQKQAPGESNIERPDRAEKGQPRLARREGLDNERAILIGHSEAR